MSDHRDIEVGDALRDLGRPDHEKDFFTRLFELMDAEQAAAGPLLPDAAPAPKRPRRWSVRRPFVLAAIATVVAGIVAFATLAGLPFAGKSGIGTGPATAAAQMLAKFSYAMAHVDSLSGTLVATGPSGDTRVKGMVEWRVEFVVTSDGDFRADAQPTGDLKAEPPLSLYYGYGSVPWAKVDAYDATSHTRWWLSDKGALDVLENAGSPLGPALWIFQSPLAYQNYASTLKALLDEGELEVEETEIDGRPAWSASYFLTGRDTSVKVGTVTLFVDRETGLLVRYTLEMLSPYEVTPLAPFRLDVRDLAVNQQVDRGIFEVPTDGVRKKSVNDGSLTFGSLPQAARRVEFDAIVPSALPDGFELAEVCSYSWNKDFEPSNLPWAVGVSILSADLPHNELNLMYRRGLEWVCIQEMPTYPAEDDRQLVLEELASTLLFMGYEKTRLDAGALAGSTAHTWLANVQSLGPGSGCGLIAFSKTEGDAAVRITGMLTRAELLDIANSLSVYEP